MEKQILKYEEFISREVKRDLNTEERERLVRLHDEMLKNFQKERSIHLNVTLFFALLAIVAVGLMAWEVTINGWLLEMIPLYVLALILVILTGFYVKYYYFLENHIQGLYKYTKELEAFDGEL
ncbi:MAG: hypothetical protein Q4A36_01545 [Candidatus Saccharibacteria bacterium]|nr:hypothetical protein [Candidatus Saccharibacteria bacterium]